MTRFRVATRRIDAAFVVVVSDPSFSFSFSFSSPSSMTRHASSSASSTPTSRGNGRREASGPIVAIVARNRSSATVTALLLGAQSRTRNERFRFRFSGNVGRSTSARSVAATNFVLPHPGGPCTRCSRRDREENAAVASKRFRVSSSWSTSSSSRWVSLFESSVPRSSATSSSASSSAATAFSSRAFETVSSKRFVSRTPSAKRHPARRCASFSDARGVPNASDS